VVRADFYNPVSQFLVRVTDPLLKPTRRLIPAIGKFDSSAWVVMLVLQMAAFALIALVQGAPLSAGWLFVRALIALLELFLNVFLFAILIQVILSWVGPSGGYNPVVSILYSLTEPVLAPCRRLLPPISGFDLSPILALIGIQLIKMLTLPLLMKLLA
jgi:YggT family protein